MFILGFPARVLYWLDINFNFNCLSAFLVFILLARFHRMPAYGYHSHYPQPSQLMLALGVYAFSFCGLHLFTLG